MSHEARGKSNEWYTPWYIFEAFGCRFDLDVASPADHETCVPADRFLTETGLTEPWSGFVWMNPPYGHQSTKRLWLAKFFDHGNGIAIVPDRTSAPWFREAWWRADAVVFVPKVKFHRWDAQKSRWDRGNGPGTGSAIIAAGERAVEVLTGATERGLGVMAAPSRIKAGTIIVQPKTLMPDDVRSAEAFSAGDRP